jgi:hypothetical protein
MIGEATSHDAGPRGRGGEYRRRVRKALLPLLADEALREQTAIKIQEFMNSAWKYSEKTSFFDFEGKVNRVVGHFAQDGLTREAYLKAAVRRVTLFFQNPETLINNIERVATHFREDGLTRELYLRSAVKQPQLFYQKPETLIGNIERVAHHFREDGLTREAYLKAAGGQPSLFFRSPATIIRHVNLINGLYRKGLLHLREPDPPRSATAVVIEYILCHPALFLMSEDNIALRERYALAAGAPLSPKALMMSPRRDIEDWLAGGTHPDEKRRQAFRLLTAAGAKN